MKALAIIPARAGSQRVKNKNIRRLAGHPLIAYSICCAIESRVFSRVIVTTDSEEIADVARHYGADVPFIRPKKLAGSKSPNIGFIKHALDNLDEEYDAFATVFATSPFRQAATLRRAMRQFKLNKEADSLRAVAKCREHPGKMWIVDGNSMEPLLDQSDLDIAWHARQYKDMPVVYVQTSMLEIAWTRVVSETNTREGRVLAPFISKGFEGLSIDYEDDWTLVERLAKSGEATLPDIPVKPYRKK
jgi:CMP-N,N'-diacetyllegionaminic acid synthase